MNNNYATLVSASACLLLSVTALAATARDSTGLVNLACTAKNATLCLQQTLGEDILEKELCAAGTVSEEINFLKYASTAYDPATGGYAAASTEAFQTSWIKHRIQLLTICMEDPQLVASVNTSDRDFMAAIKPLSSLGSDTANVWTSQFLLGYMQQSSYDETGKSAGLNESSATALVSFNGRWFGDSGKADSLLNTEIGVLFAQSGVTEPGQEDAATEVPAAPTAPKQPAFTDVKDSIDSYLKITYSPDWSWLKSRDYRSVLAAGVLAGLKSRDSITLDNDSVISYFGATIEYNYYPANIKQQGNQLPTARLGFSWLKFEEYGGLAHQDRWVINADYHPLKDNAFVVGLRANLGDGLDDVGVFVGVRKTTAELLDFFSAR